MRIEAVMHRWVALSSALAAIAAGLQAQTVWRVNCHGGPGVHFTDLPPAVAAAAPGDTILIYYQGSVGCPAHYTAPTITKALRIERFNVNTIPTSPAVPANPSSVYLYGVLSIHDIPAGEQVVISNIQLGMQLLTTPQSTGFSIIDCEGSVLLEDVSFDSVGLTGSVLTIDGCRHVVLRDCEIYLGGVPVTIRDSTVLVTTTALHHNAPLPSIPPLFVFPSYTQSIPALDVYDSDVTIVGSVLRGNELVVGSGNPQPAVRFHRSRLYLGPDAFLRGSGGNLFPWLAFYAPSPAGSEVFLDPRANVSAINTNVPPAPVTTWLDAVYHARVVAGYPYYVSMAGPPDGFALLLLGNLLPDPWQTPFGDLAMDPCTAQPVALVHLQPGTGYYQWTLPCPATAPVAFPFVFQALTLSPSGSFGLTLPSPLTVGWPHGQVP